MNNKETAFIQYSQVRELTHRSLSNVASTFSSGELTNTKIKKLSLQDMVNTILCPNDEKAKSILKTINQSVMLRSQYKETLNDLANNVTHLTVAADSASVSDSQFNGEKDFSVFTRRGTGFELKFVSANQLATELFIILKLDEPTTQQKEHGVCLHANWQESFNVIHLFHTTDGKFQAIIGDSDNIYSACFDLSTQWYIL